MLFEMQVSSEKRKVTETGGFRERAKPDVGLIKRVKESIHQEGGMLYGVEPIPNCSLHKLSINDFN